MNETFSLDSEAGMPRAHSAGRGWKRKIKAFSHLAVQSGARGLTGKFWNHMNNVLLPKLAERDGYRNLLDRTLKDEATGSSASAARPHAWMRRCARKWINKQGAYTDVHEDEETKYFRKEYLVTNAGTTPRRTWVQIKKGYKYKAACTEANKVPAGSVMTASGNLSSQTHRTRTSTETWR